MQSEMRTDPAALRYLDDLASIDPVLDKLAQGPEIKYGMDSKAASTDAAKAKEEIEGKGKDKDKPSAAPNAAERAKKKLAEADEDPALRRLIQQTGFTAEQIRNFKVKTLVQHAVVNQTRLGKIRSLYFLTIAGNGNGLLGIGEGKAMESEDGQRQSIMSAIRNMKPINRYESRTIYGDLHAKVGAVHVQLSARPPGMMTVHVHNVLVLINIHRIRQSLPASHLRNVSRRRHQRPCRSRGQSAKQDERLQSDVQGPTRSEDPRRCCSCARAEDGGCAESVLCWEGVLERCSDMYSFVHIKRVSFVCIASSTAWSSCVS